jgi:uncharacterized membrane protein YagU involved in acid resistance
MSTTTRPTPLGAIVRGLIAGAVGTGIMTVAQELPARLQPSGDSGQSGDGGDAPRDPWEQASVPAQVARRISEGVFHREIAAERIPLLTHAMHWAYGTGWGAVYGLLAGTRDGGSLPTGALFGSGVWSMSYVQLVPMGLYEPPWTYAAKDVAMEVGYHLAYGIGVAGAYRRLAGR